MENKKERKSFQDLPGEENPQFSEDGYKIYLQLRQQYGIESSEACDNILNALCAALVFMTKDLVAKDNHKNFQQLIYKIISKNLDGR